MYLEVLVEILYELIEVVYLRERNNDKVIRLVSGGYEYIPEFIDLWRSHETGLTLVYIL